VGLEVFCSRVLGNFLVGLVVFILWAASWVFFWAALFFF
jgi:hypothetical protein